MACEIDFALEITAVPPKLWRHLRQLVLSSRRLQMLAVIGTATESPLAYIVPLRNNVDERRIVLLALRTRRRSSQIQCASPSDVQGDPTNGLILLRTMEVLERVVMAQAN